MNTQTPSAKRTHLVVTITIIIKQNQQLNHWLQKIVYWVSAYEIKYIIRHLHRTVHPNAEFRCGPLRLSLGLQCSIIPIDPIPVSHPICLRHNLLFDLIRLTWIEQPLKLDAACTRHWMCTADCVFVSASVVIQHSKAVIDVVLRRTDVFALCSKFVLNFRYQPNFLTKYFSLWPILIGFNSILIENTFGSRFGSVFFLVPSPSCASGGDE